MAGDSLRSMRRLSFTIWLLFTSVHVALPERVIDRCAQDGAWFYTMSDDKAHAVQIERDGVALRIEHPNTKSLDAVVTLQNGRHTLVQEHKVFEAAQGWLTVSPSGAFATTWKDNASDAQSQLFRVTSDGEIVEDTVLISLAEKTFISDATRICKRPGVNTTAIKWRDDDHLLLSIDAWGSGSCYSNFTEGFVVSLAQHRIERKLTERKLINLPAVCTWNLVSNQRR